MRIKAFIAGCKGTSLSVTERDFFAKHQPWGFILFGRNVESREQLSRLVEELRSCVEHQAVPVLIDQEGGRVRRLRPPDWPEYPSGCLFGELYERDQAQGLRLAWLQSRLMACDLLECGINVDCLPVLDVPVPGGHDVIGDRAYSHDTDTVCAIGKAAAEGLLDGGVLPVIKHIPGHGRAGSDSHKSLPIVDTDIKTLEETDFKPFRVLSQLPLAMTAHVVYNAIDPESPATTSSKVIGEMIRGHIGFEGLLMSDDLSMQALSGDFSQRTKSAFAAGCDVVLHCNGEMEEMREVAEAAPELTGNALLRAESALACLGKQTECEELALRKEFHELRNIIG